MGKLFVIDGTDGSGKQTQATKLKERFDREGIKYMNIEFPNYDSLSSSLVKMYLNGEFGKDAKEISPYIASTFYAADRYATYKTEFSDYYNNGGIVIVDRYTSSNMIHQAGKIKDESERNKFLRWLWNFEFELYKIPVPTKVFFLNMPPKKSIELMENRNNKFTGTAKKDIHESDENHINDAYEAACSLINKYDWFEVKCLIDGNLRTIDDIHEEIFQEIKKEL